MKGGALAAVVVGRLGNTGQRGHVQGPQHVDVPMKIQQSSFPSEALGFRTLCSPQALDRGSLGTRWDAGEPDLGQNP